MMRYLFAFGKRESWERAETGGAGGGRQETSYQRPAEKSAGSFSGRRKKGAGGERQCLTGEGKGTIINEKKFRKAIGYFWKWNRETDFF